MKRAVVVGLVLVCMGALAFAATNVVTSVNVVGYNKVQLPPGGKFVQVSMNFDAFDPTLEGTLGLDQLTPGKKTSQADRVYVWDATAQAYSIYAINSANGKFNDIFAWGTATNPPLVAGQAFWLESGSDAADTNTVALMGEAVDVVTQEVGIVPGFQMVGYPFSADVEVQDFNFLNSGATPGKKTSQADKIYIWDGAAYKIYGLNSSDNMWHDVFDWTGPAVGDTVELGQGFWYESIGTFTWSETNTYLNNL